MAVIRPTIETDPEVIAQIAFDYLQRPDVLPGWTPVEGDLLTWTIRAHARMVAEERDVANDVPLAQIMQPLGEQVYRLPPHRATPATARATVTVRDTAGYTIPAGLELLVRTSGNEGVTMVTTEAVTIARGLQATAAGELKLTAATGYEGTIGNGLTEDNEVTPIRALEFVEQVELVGVSRGGADEEDEEVYLQRLADFLALSSPTPILPRDFARFALQQQGVGRALAINLTEVTPEIISIAAASGGSGTITLADSAGGSVTLTPTSTAAAVAAAFTGLTSYGYTASASGGPLGTAPVVLTLGGRRAYGPWQLSTTGARASVTQLQKGSIASPVPRALAVAVTDDAGEPLSAEAKGIVQDAIDDVREVNWIASVTDPNYTRINVTFTAVAWPEEDPLTVRAAAIAALQRFLSPGTWGRSPYGDAISWSNETTIRYLEVAQALNEVAGLRYVTSLQIGRDPGTLGTADIVMTGQAPLPRAGSNITGEVREG